MPVQGTSNKPKTREWNCEHDLRLFSCLSHLSLISRFLLILTGLYWSVMEDARRCCRAAALCRVIIETMCGSGGILGFLASPQKNTKACYFGLFPPARTAVTSAIFLSLSHSLPLSLFLSLLRERGQWFSVLNAAVDVEYSQKQMVSWQKNLLK